MKASLPRRVWRKGTEPFRLSMRSLAADAFLVSYPKSGRTWFRFILANYFDRAEKLGTNVNLHTMFSVVPNYALDKGRGIGAFQFAERRPRLPFILVTHFSYHWYLFHRKPIIFMVRDPRDVAVSAFFHATRHKHRFKGDMSQFLADPDQGIMDLVRYMNGWAKGLQKSPHYILTYEKLLSDTETQTANVLRFLNCSIDAGALREAVAASRFDAMRNLEKSEGIPDHEYDRSDEESLRMRRGKAGGYADYLKAEQLSFIESTLAERLSPEAKGILRQAELDLFKNQRSGL